MHRIAFELAIFPCSEANEEAGCVRGTGTHAATHIMSSAPLAARVLEAPKTLRLTVFGEADSARTDALQAWVRHLGRRHFRLGENLGGQLRDMSVLGGAGLICRAASKDLMNSKKQCHVLPCLAGYTAGIACIRLVPCM
jgi:hypothetical protein